MLATTLDPREKADSMNPPCVQAMDESNILLNRRGVGWYHWLNMYFLSLSVMNAHNMQCNVAYEYVLYYFAMFDWQKKELQLRRNGHKCDLVLPVNGIVRSKSGARIKITKTCQIII